ncbi:hypothetical protein [Kitasatospora sp. NBC_01539]|uniref:hypothetical protein n=1 Tax=Kitasatospora sp. NBC_01539 TaxID=2903577 RepID=UPI0038600DA9
MELATARFIEAATALPAGVLAAVREESLARWRRGGREASRATRVSASENSAIEHAVRSALLRRGSEPGPDGAMFPSDVKPLCAIAARAVCKRAKLTEEQYRVLLDPFAAVGVAVPDRDAAGPAVDLP